MPHDKDALRVALGLEGVVLHEVVVIQEVVLTALDHLVGISNSELGILGVGILVGTTHIKIYAREHSLSSSLGSVGRTIVVAVGDEVLDLLEVVDGLLVALCHGERSQDPHRCRE